MERVSSALTHTHTLMPAWARLSACCMAPLSSHCDAAGQGDDEPLDSSPAAETQETHLEGEVSDP